jgi:hypothetical protein
MYEALLTNNLFIFFNFVHHEWVLNADVNKINSKRVWSVSADYEVAEEYMFVELMDMYLILGECRWISVVAVRQFAEDFLITSYKIP